MLFQRPVQEDVSLGEPQELSTRSSCKNILRVFDWRTCRWPPCRHQFTLDRGTMLFILHLLLCFVIFKTEEHS